MLLTEYNQEKVLAQERNDSFEQGIEQGIEQTNERFITNMLRKNLPLSLIMEISQLSENAIRNIAASLGLAVM